MRTHWYCVLRGHQWARATGGIAHCVRPACFQRALHVLEPTYQQRHGTFTLQYRKDDNLPLYRKCNVFEMVTDYQVLDTGRTVEPSREK